MGETRLRRSGHGFDFNLKTMKPNILCFPALAALALPLAVEAAPGTQALTVTHREELVATPAKPDEVVVLRVEIPWQKLRVSGSDIKEVRATVEYPSNTRDSGRTSVDGMRRLNEPSGDAFQILARGNDIWLSGGGKYQWAAEFDVKVPANARLVLRSQSGGDIEVTGMSGDVEIYNTMGGGVVLRQVTGPTVVEVLDGDIDVTYAAPPQQPASFTSRSGEIVIQLPSAAKSTLKLRAHTGAIYTDFSSEALRAFEDTSSRNEAIERKRQAEQLARSRQIERGVAARASGPSTGAIVAVPGKTVPTVAGMAEAMTVQSGFFRSQTSSFITGGKKVAYTLNGGGTEIFAATINGAITLRQAP